METQRLQSLLSELVAKHKVPGAAVGVLHDGELTQAAAGVINLDTGVETTTDTLFQIGSISKVWTTTVVMQLVDEGTVSLDEPVRSYLPGFKVADPEVSAAVTLRHLLSHTSGIDGDHFEDFGRGDDCIERYVDACATLGQTHKLGETMSYCNTGFTIAGRIIEVVTGGQWDAVMRERLFAPLGLTHTNTLPEEALLYRAAVGHLPLAPGDPPSRAPVWMLPRIAGPMGLINSTVADVLAFAKMHMDLGTAADGARILSEASVKAMQEPQVAIPDRHTLGSHWGVGWILFDWGGHKLYGHDGGTIGQSAFLRVAPGSNLAVCLLTNGGEPHAPHLLYFDVYTRLFDELAGISVPQMPAAPETPLEMDVQPYAGTYERLGVRIDLRPSEGCLEGTTTMSGPLARMLPDPVQDIRFVAVDSETFLVYTGGGSVPVPAVFYDFVDGVPRYVHFGARTHPRMAVQ
jgi:CubicO group peptidase (beta-lactamase class C family)